MMYHGAAHERSGLHYCDKCKAHFDPSAPHSCEPYKHQISCKDCAFHHKVASSLAGDIELESLHHISDRDGWCALTKQPGRQVVTVGGVHKHKHHDDAHKDLVLKIHENHS